MIFMLLSISATADADSNKDISTISKAIGFIQSGPTGTINMAIVYNPESKESLSHANEVAKLTSSPIGSDKVKLIGKKALLSSLEKETYKVIFITRGMTKDYPYILKKANEMKAITVSTDNNCLENNGCLLTIKTDPYIDIMMNTKIAKETHIKFASAFSMMIIKK